MTAAMAKPVMYGPVSTLVRPSVASILPINSGTTVPRQMAPIGYTRLRTSRSRGAFRLACQNMRSELRSMPGLVLGFVLLICFIVLLFQEAARLVGPEPG